MKHTVMKKRRNMCQIPIRELTFNFMCKRGGVHKKNAVTGAQLCCGKHRFFRISLTARNSDSIYCHGKAGKCTDNGNGNNKNKDKNKNKNKNK